MYILPVLTVHLRSTYKVTLAQFLETWNVHFKFYIKNKFSQTHILHTQYKPYSHKHMDHHFYTETELSVNQIVNVVYSKGNTMYMYRLNRVL